jgi:hypothetical protein
LLFAIERKAASIKAGAEPNSHHDATANSLGTASRATFSIVISIKRSTTALPSPASRQTRSWSSAAARRLENLELDIEFLLCDLFRFPTTIN